MMHKRCCTYREHNHGVLGAFMSDCLGTFFGDIPFSGDNFCLVRVISREFGRVLGWQYTMMLRAMRTARFVHHMSALSPQLSRYLINITRITQIVIRSQDPPCFDRTDPCPSNIHCFNMHKMK